jgi:DNA-directed DNA polymerase III PolC
MWLAIPEATEEEFLNTERIAAECDVELPKASVVQYPDPTPLRDLCIAGAQERRIWPMDETYIRRMELELDLITQKKFEDYFYVIADLVRDAKTKMLVGPARGSSAGSLVCYLLGITDVDPLVHDLMFERFIDVTRADLPDIDIDFQDDKRELVAQHLAEKYGPERVGRLGTILTYKAKSALGDVAKTVGIPTFEIADLKGAIIERSSGDARAQFCIKDTFESLDVGKRLLAKYPALALAGDLEGHAQYSGTHAAGLIVTNDPVTRYAAIDQSGCVQVDKKSAEVLNILKIDALGLRTLSVLSDTLAQIGKDREWLVRYPLDDTAAFEIFNQERFTGIFQYEGYALQTLTKQMKIRSFDDVAIITALARPGPLHCGAANEFIDRRTGKTPVSYLHPLAEPFTRTTYGTVIYQEQVMMVCREIGKLSWDDVQTIRRAMSKSLGDEFFGKYWERFRDGAVSQGINEGEARGIWDKICTFGSWAFNKSHAISYGLISYWCAVLKAHYPLEFAAACLRSAKDDEQAIRMLRELVEEGYEYVPVDPQRSGLSWEVHDGKLLGGLTNIKGLGPAKAALVLAARNGGKALTPGLARLLEDPRTPYDDIFTGRRRFAHLLANPRKYKVTSGPITPVREINGPGDYIFIARIREKNQRDLNEWHSLNARGGRVITKQSLFLNLVLEDDTGLIFGTIDRWLYETLGKPIVEQAKVGDWYLWKGTVKPNWQKVYIHMCRTLEDGKWPE